MTNKIEYYASNSTMGDTPDVDCDKYRQWALEQIENAYPGYDIAVIKRECLVNSWTNDEEKREEIIDFCSRLWDRCPWDWIANTVTVYKLEELDESTQQKAYERFMINEPSYEWWNLIYDDVKRTAEFIGIDIDNIYFSGFSSQGDGACFEGSYRYAPGWRKALISEYGKDNASLKEVIEIAEGLQAEQRKAFYHLSASVKHRGHYYHSGCTDVTVYNDDSAWTGLSDDQEESITQLLREYMDYIYKCLEREYEYLTSMQSFIEACEANDHEFDEYGNLV